MGLPDEGEMNMYGYQAPYAHNYGRTTQNGFGGINAALSADNGEVLSLLDMCSDNYPLLSTRPERWLAGTYTGDIIAAANVNGRDAYIRRNASGYTFVYNGTEYDFSSEMSPTRGRIVGLGSYILLFPFGMYLDTRAKSITQLTAADYSANLKEGGGFNRTATITGSSGVSYTHTFSEGELFNVTGMLDGSLGRVAGIYEYSQGYARRIGFEFGEMKSKVVLSCKFSNGTYAGESAAGNTIELQYNTTTEINLYPNLFRPGDAVKISGCATVEANNKTAVIREVSDGVPKLIFYENTFTLPEGQTEYTEESVTIERDIPKLSIVFSHNNRLWGANDRSIYCSKAGDPFIWSDYESLADGCWWADSGCIDLYGITGGFAYEYPRFFSDEHIYTVYGNTPEDFSISCVEAKGTPIEEDESFATAGGVLFYLSDNGFMAYTGSYPQKIDTQLGNKRFINARAASDGRKYYVQCYEWDGLHYGSRHFYVYDTLYGVWHEESTDAQIQGFFPGFNLIAAYGGEIWTLGKPNQRPVAPTGDYASDTPTGKVIFADFTMDSVNRKQLKDIIIRHDIGGELTVRLYIDDVLDDSFTRTLTGAGKRTSILPCVPKRCDHWHLELEGPGPWVVYSVAANYIEGSAKK